MSQWLVQGSGDVPNIREEIPMDLIRASYQRDSVMEEGLLDDHSRPQPDAENKTPSSKQTPSTRLVKTVARSLRLTLAKSLIASRWETQIIEERKVAMYKNRIQAAIRCSIHIVPVAAALALIGLNTAEYYVGGELAGPTGQDDQKLGALQFAAKLHELLMIASLATVIFTYVRRELVFGEGVPFGALSAGLEIDKFSFLYSPELWSAIWAEWERKHKKWVLLTLLVCSTLLGVTVGPSTANLMRPRFGDWPAGGTTFWAHADKGVLSPTLLDQSASPGHCHHDSGQLACPHGDWGLIASQYQSYWPALKPMGNMPEVLSIPSQLSSRTMVVRHRSTEESVTKSIWQNAFSSATIQHSVVADALSEVGRLWAYAAANNNGNQKFMFRRDATYTTIAPQPVAQARCVETLVDPSNNFDGDLQFPVLARPNCNGDSSHCFVDSPSHLTLENTTLARLISQKLASHELPELSWIDVSEFESTPNASIFAVATFPKTLTNDTRIYCCSIDSRIAVNAVTASRNLPKVVTGYPPDFKRSGTNNASWPRTVIHPSWAEMLDPTLSTENATVFSSMSAIAGMWNTSPPSASYNYPFIVESILAMLVVNGIARTTYNESLVGSLRGSIPSDPWAGGAWIQEMIPKHSLGWGGSAFEANPAALLHATQFTMYATVKGYAWSNAGMLQKAAIVVLFVYSFLALAHSAYSIKTGWSSTSWDTTPEIVALAMNSLRPSELHNTGAGIDTVHPLKQKVKIRRVNYHLEYVFSDAQDKGAQVKPNRLYS